GGGGGRRKRGSRERKGQGEWGNEGDFAKKEKMLDEMKWPKTRRKALMVMWESDLVLKPEEYSALLTAACHLGWAAMASTIMEEMIASGVPVTTATYDAAIKAACKANKDRLALLLIVDQYARWQAEKLGDKAAFLVKGVGEGGKAAIAAGRVGGGNSKGLTKSYFRTNLAKVLQATSRTGDVEGSLEVLKYMSAMGISANSAVCQHLLATACKVGSGNPARVPLILRAMGESGLRPDMSLLDVLEMLFDANSPEVALDLLLEVVNAGREGKGIGKLWRFETNASAAEAFSLVFKRAEEMGRLDVVQMTIQAVLRYLPRSLYFSRSGVPPAMADGDVNGDGDGDGGDGEAAAVGASPAGAAAAAAAIRGDKEETGRRVGNPIVDVDDDGDDVDDDDDDDDDDGNEDDDDGDDGDEDDDDDDDDDVDNFEGKGVFYDTGVGAGADAGDGAGGGRAGGGVSGGESASKLSSAVSGALTGARAGGRKAQDEVAGGAAAAAGAEAGAQQKKNAWARLGQKELNRHRRSEAIYRQKQGVWVLNHILGDLANSFTSGNTAAGVLDRWRCITLGGEWAGGEGGVAVGEEGGATAMAAEEETEAEVVRYSRPTEASYKFTMSALVQSGQWGRARSLLEVMRVDGVPPKVDCHSHLLTLLHTRLASRSPGPHQEDEGSLSPVEAFLWSEPTYEWDEVLSLMRDARSAEQRGEYEVTKAMYHTALDVLLIVSQRPFHASLGVVAAGAPLPPPPAKVFLERAECLLDWALDAGVETSVDLLFPLVTLSHAARDAAKVFEYFEAMLELDIPRQGREYNSMFDEAYNMAIHACEFGGEPERALAYMRTMRSASGLKPSARQYEGAINAMVTAGRFRDAYQLLAEAVENGMETISVYDAAMRACAKQRNPAQAETLVRIMLEMGLSPGSEAMSQLLLAYGNAGDVDGIQSVMTRAGNEVFTTGVMNALVYESVLRVLAPLEAWQDAETFVKEGEMVLPGSLTYRTYGYLMVAYAAEKQWGAAIELALGTGRWPEKTSGGPEGRFHPPELRETTCAVALKWLLTHGVDGAESIASGGRGEDNEGGDGGEQQTEAMVERALEYRKCGRELFTRLLASGAPLRSVRVITAALAGVGAELAGPSSPSEPPEGSEDAPIYWKQTMPFWGDPEQPSSSPSRSTVTTSPANHSTPLASDWLLSVLPEEEAEREVAAQALHVVAVVEVFLRSYWTPEQPGASEFHSPTAVGLLQQAISAACWADDPDLADRLLTAWLDIAFITQPLQARLRTALRISLSEVLAAFFAEGQGEEGVYRGLSLIGRCRDAGLSPYPFDFLGAMRACNTAGLYSTALRLFDQLTAASNPSRSSEYPGGHSEYPEDLDDRDVHFPGASDSDLNSGSGSEKPEEPRNHLSGSTHREAGRRSHLESEVNPPGAVMTAATREQSAAVDDARNSDSRGNRDDHERSGRKGGVTSVEAGEGGRRANGGSGMMAFENLNDIPDGELIPAAAATIALESCFLSGRRDQAMEIVWQLIRRRHPLTEACRNRAIVALTSGGHPDMALDMARGMEKDQHYADRATVEFVERFQKRAFDTAKAHDSLQEGEEEEGEEEEEEEEGEGGEEEEYEEEEEEEEYAGEEEEEEKEEEEEEDEGEEDEEDGMSGREVVSSGKLASPTASSGRGGGRSSSSSGSSSDRPSELVLRFLPLLSETLRSKLRPGED
ncbi:unnamed protein product, partial [Pylaiella littoralis]